MIDPVVPAQAKYYLPFKERVNLYVNIMVAHNPLAFSIRTPGRRFRYIRGWDGAQDSGAHQSAALEEIKQVETWEGVSQGIYISVHDVEGVLRDLKAADLGISIVVSGIFENVFEICQNVGIEPHTANMSLGVWGKTELLPQGEILDIVSMCGHGLISPQTFQAVHSEVVHGSLSLEAASIELAKQCTCNIFNIERSMVALEMMDETIFNDR